MADRWRTVKNNVAALCTAARQEFPRADDAFEKVLVQAAANPKGGAEHIHQLGIPVRILTMQAQPAQNLPEVTIVYRFSDTEIVVLGVKFRLGA